MEQEQFYLFIKNTMDAFALGISLGVVIIVIIVLIGYIKRVINKHREKPQREADKIRSITQMQIFDYLAKIARDHLGDKDFSAEIQIEVPQFMLTESGHVNYIPLLDFISIDGRSLSNDISHSITKIRYAGRTFVLTPPKSSEPKLTTHKEPRSNS